MVLELLESISKILAAPPTNQRPRWPLMLAPARIVVCHGEVLERHEKVRHKRVVVLPMLHALAMHVATQDVHMQMIHARDRVHANLDLGRPVAPGRQDHFFFSFSFLAAAHDDILPAVQHGIARGFGAAVAAERALELLRDEVLEASSVGADIGEEDGVSAVEGFEWVEKVFGGIAGKEEGVDCGLWKEIADGDGMGGLEDDSGVGAGGVGEVEAQTVAAAKVGRFPCGSRRRFGRRLWLGCHEGCDWFFLGCLRQWLETSRWCI